MTQTTTHLIHPRREVTCCDVAKGQSLVATGTQDGKIFLWDSSEGVVLVVCEGGHDGQVNGVTFNEGGAGVASCGEDGGLLLWDLRNISQGVTFRRLAGHDGAALLCCRFSPDATLMATGGRDHDIMVWGNLGRPVHGRLRAHSAWVSSVCFTADSRKLVSGGYDHLICVWSMENFACIKLIRYTRCPVLSVAGSVEGSVIAAGTDSGLVFLFRASDATCLRILRGHDDDVTSTSFVEESGIMFTSSRDSSVKAWDLTGRCLKSFKAHDGSVLSCATSKDFIVTTGIDFSARIVAFGWIDAVLDDDDDY